MNNSISYIWQKHKHWLLTLFYLAMFLWWIFDFAIFRNSILSWISSRPNLIQRTSLATLAYQHVEIVVISTGVAIVLAIGLGGLVRITRSSELRTLFINIGSMGETIPSAAIIALSVPLFGYGNFPIILALTIYAILPIVRNTIVGLDSIALEIDEAAQGSGMTLPQQLIKIDFPLALPTILAGIKTALIINISAATIGATVGAGGFGVLIIAGIRTYDSLMVIQGSVPVILLALFVDRILRIRN